jgi:hypothetical protein
MFPLHPSLFTVTYSHSNSSAAGMLTAFVCSQRASVCSAAYNSDQLHAKNVLCPRQLFRCCAVPSCHCVGPMRPSRSLTLVSTDGWSLGTFQLQAPLTQCTLQRGDNARCWLRGTKGPFASLYWQSHTVRYTSSLCLTKHYVMKAYGAVDV